VLTGQDDLVSHAVAVANRSATPARRFSIAPEDLLRIQREARDAGEDVVGYYHSHPRHPAVPSETDRQQAAEGMPLSDGMRHLIVSIDDAGVVAVAAWRFDGGSGRFEVEGFATIDG
jgi:proteasome lid subunit RPN8/RPN11